MTDPQATSAASIDPVCEMTMDIDAARQNRMTITYKGTEYPFCCDGCKSTFEADPQKYHEAAGAASTQ